MKQLKQAHGNWVSGPGRFWNRKNEVSNMIEYLKEEAHILLIAQRRIGKTSLMKEVARKIESDFICLDIDLQGSYTAEDFIVELSTATYPHKKLWGKTQTVFSNIFGKAKDTIDYLQIEEVKIKIRDGLIGGNWETKGNKLFKVLANDEKPVVIFMDEIPIMVNRMLKNEEIKMTSTTIKIADNFMSWLRKKAIENKEKIRIVLAGSIGLEPILRQAGLSATINIYKSFEINAWDDKTAIGCLEALANKYKLIFDGGVCELIVKKIGCCIPHHVQMYFSHIYEACKKRGDMVCSIDIANKVYDSSMLSSRGHAELSTFEERLKMMVGEEILPLAMDMLTEAAVVGYLSYDAANIFCKEYEISAKKCKDTLRLIFDILEHDGYLVRQNDHYKFISKLLKDWWKTRHNFGYVPAAQRSV